MNAYLHHRQAIADMLDPRRYRIEHVDSEVQAGHWHVIGDERAVILFEEKTYPTGARDIHGICAAGELGAIVELIRKAEQWALDNGCIGAEISSREGWSKVMVNEGYCVHQVTIRKDLGN